MLHLLVTLHALFAVASATATDEAKPKSPESDASLPEIDTVLHGSAESMDSFSKQYADMEASMVKKQKETTESLVAMKADYERQLASQDENNTVTAQNNQFIQTEIDVLRKQITALESGVKTVREGNEVLKMGIHELAPSFEKMKSSVQKALSLQDEDKKLPLRVLEPSKEQALDHFLQITGVQGKVISDRRSSTGGKAPLMLINTKQTAPTSPQSSPSEDGGAYYPPEVGQDMMNEKWVSRQDPRDLVRLLANTFEDLAKAQQQGADELKTNFNLAMETRQVRQASLLHESRALDAERQKLRDRLAALQPGKANLERTTKELKDRLEAITSFASNVDQSVTDVLHQAKAILDKR